MARSRSLPLGLLAYGAAVWTIPVLAALGPKSATDPGCASAERAEAPEPPAAVDPLRGLWSRFEPGAPGDPVRFYYFHGDGHGLYRYGRVGLTNTHSFDYEVEGETVALRFRKTGEAHRLGFVLRADPDRTGRTWLELAADPREPEPVRYFRDELGRVLTEETPVLAAADGGVGGRLWIDRRRFATGGEGFSLYQLRSAGIDGRGTGWHHRGDFDEWTTESLAYHVVGDRLLLSFPVRGDGGATSFSIDRGGEAARLSLREDPRDFWHAAVYVDAGPAFGSAGSGLAAVLERQQQ